MVVGLYCCAFPTTPSPCSCSGTCPAGAWKEEETRRHHPWAGLVSCGEAGCVLLFPTAPPPPTLPLPPPPCRPSIPGTASLPGSCSVTHFSDFFWMCRSAARHTVVYS